MSESDSSPCHAHQRREPSASNQPEVVFVSGAGHQGPELADIIRAHAEDYIALQGGVISERLRRVLEDLCACRTAALGGHAAKCDHCGHCEIFYNSCRNRHCPKCSGAARARWFERCQQDLLPVHYFQVVFTLPHELSRLSLANPSVAYNLLFQAASATLKEVAADPKHLGAQIGATLVLHTWGQQLEHHPHVHAVVPGGGLSLDGKEWISAPENFFLPVKVLSQVFRGKYLAGLKEAHQNGKLQLQGELTELAETKSFDTFLSKLYAKDWVVYSQAPVDATDSNPESVLKYLARYVSGIAISNARLVSFENGNVTFRWKNYAAENREETMTLSATEFLRRFLMHVLPSGFVRIRHYGLLSNRRRKERLAFCRELLGVSTDKNPEQKSSEETPEEETDESPVCSVCQIGHLRKQVSWPRPPRRQWSAQRLWAPRSTVEKRDTS